MGEKKVLDAKGLKCPQPILKVAAMAKSLSEGDTLEILADCPSFPRDIESWCERTGKFLVNFQEMEDGSYKAEVEF